ncbi:hypothetical protein [Streptomyces sp. NPDC059063]|uniref:hypothetical protein n=1 Tax=Streptomyces sp. NPDC059063 TaxID=3346712 RepID=UPI0036C8C8DC
MKAAKAVRSALALTAVLLLAGCGVRPTGVLDGGGSAGGLTKGLRLYFVSQALRLKALSRPTVPMTCHGDFSGVIKYLVAGPTEAERASGLTTLLEEGSYEATAKGDTVTVRAPVPELSASRPGDRNVLGQLVCSFARARAVSGGDGDGDGAKRTDDIRVTVRPWDGRSGTYVCSDFLK